MEGVDSASLTSGENCSPWVEVTSGLMTGAASDCSTSETLSNFICCTSSEDDTSDISIDSLEALNSEETLSVLGCVVGADASLLVSELITPDSVLGTGDGGAMAVSEAELIFIGALEAGVVAGFALAQSGYL